MFKSYRKSLINTGETLELSGAVIKSIFKYLPNDPYLNRNSEEIQSGVNDIITLQAREFGNSLTGSLKNLDTERGDLNAGLEGSLKSEIRLRKYSPKKGDAAEALQATCEAHPVNNDASYAEESNQNNIRIHALSTPENLAHFDTLNMTPLFDTLKMIQAQFEQVSSDKDAQEAVKLRGTVNIQVKRLEQRLDWMFPYLESQALANPAEYGSAAEEIRESISRIMASAEARRTRKNSDSAN
ncbi:MAG: hypothetical protein GY777_08440 [Candidatus Brocadiaceae bacterium]|nr:hypothetical protein [Candidatus Brocadiaceae bacterium]